MRSCFNKSTPSFDALLQGRPDAVAEICGAPDFPRLRGKVRFYQTSCGVLVAADIAGLPTEPLKGQNEGSCRERRSAESCGTPRFTRTDRCGRERYSCQDPMPLFETGASCAPCSRKESRDFLSSCDKNDDCQSRIFGFHIHEGGCCRGNESDPFADTLSHYNPNGCEHPAHAGDLPPLFGNKGCAFSAFLTDRFTVEEIIGRTVVIHDMPDDFTTQPAGGSGSKIGCGVICDPNRRNCCTPMHDRHGEKEHSSNCPNERGEGCSMNRSGFGGDRDDGCGMNRGSFGGNRDDGRGMNRGGFGGNRDDGCGMNRGGFSGNRDDSCSMNRGSFGGNRDGGCGMNRGSMRRGCKD